MSQEGANCLENKRIGMGAASIIAGLMDAIKIIVIIVLFAIVFSLGSALFHLSSGKGDSKKMARALTIRIGLSVVLFALLMLAWKVGLIQPHGINR
jgi:hypothetical protein